MRTTWDDMKEKAIAYNNNVFRVECDNVATVKKGDKVVTIGGIHGVVSSTKDKTVIVKVDDGCKIEFSRSAIAGVENTDEKSKNEEASKEADSSETK